MKRSHLLTAILVSAAALMTACQADLPIKEMAEAKSAITLAEKYQAATYAKEEFDAAAKSLLDSHEAVKNEKAEDAKKAALDSKAKADAALAKALPLLAKDTLGQASAALAEAKDMSAEEFAKEKYDAADALVKDASAKYDAKDYIPCYETALKAKDAADATKAEVLANIPVLRARLSQLHDTSVELRANGGDAAAKEELDAADEKISEGETALAANKVKPATEAVVAAADYLAGAREKVRKYSTDAKIASAESAYAKLQGAPAAGSFTDRLSNIGALISDAKVLRDAGTFDDADAKAAEALSACDLLAIEMQKKEEEDKAAAALAAEKAKQGEPAKPEVKAETKDQPEVSREYVVVYNPKSADCLWKIAEKMYKNAKLWPLIFMANRAQIKDPDLIYPGQKFSIPPVPRCKPEGKEEPAKTEPAADAVKADAPKEEPAAAPDAAAPSVNTPADTAPAASGADAAPSAQ